MHRALALTSRFCVPELGMTSRDVLSRASAVVVAATPEFAAQVGNPKVHVLSSQHVTCPYNFPHYYPPEEFGWLQAVDEGHISVEVEARSDDGTILQEAKCARRMFPHTHRDVVCLHLEDEEEALERLGVQVLALQTTPVEEGTREKLMFSGHFLELPTPDTGASPPAPGSDVEQAMSSVEQGSASDSDADSVADPTAAGTVDHDIAVSVPRDVEGLLELRSDLQTFCRTAVVLEMGMCGGPVTNAAGECVGIVEGVVPSQLPPAASEAMKAVAGHAVFIEAETLAEFVGDVEAEWTRLRHESNTAL